MTEHVDQDTAEPRWPGGLTAREAEVADLLARGYRTTEIGPMLFISVKTVDTHRGHILKKLGLRCAVALARYAIRLGIVSGAAESDAPGCTGLERSGS